MELTQDLSPWGMFAHAVFIVKLVMIGLAIASLVTWADPVGHSDGLRFASRRWSKFMKPPILRRKVASVTCRTSITVVQKSQL
jgi:hypothetical protein